MCKDGLGAFANDFAICNIEVEITDGRTLAGVSTAEENSVDIARKVDREGIGGMARQLGTAIVGFVNAPELFPNHLIRSFASAMMAHATSQSPARYRLRPLPCRLAEARPHR